jgi:hypothetical protein
MYCYLLSDVSSNVYVIAIFLIVYFQTSPIGTFMIYVITKFHKLRYSTMGVKLGVMLREESRLRVIKDGVLRRLLGPTEDGVKGGGEDYVMRSLMICTVHQMLCEWTDKEKRVWRCM